MTPAQITAKLSSAQVRAVKHLKDGVRPGSIYVRDATIHALDKHGLVEYRDGRNWLTDLGRAVEKELRGKSIKTKQMRPRLSKPISKAQVRRELLGLARQFDIECVVDFPKSLTAEHRRNPRRYAQVGLEEDPIVFEFADQICQLPERYRMGLYVHEIGHVLDPDPAKTEDGADRAGMRAFDVLIVYDHRWPGKGLQTAVW